MAAQQKIGGVAGRYAKALFDLAVEENSVPATAQSLTTLHDMISGSAELQNVLHSPVFKSEDQMAVLETIAGQSGLSGLALNFAKLMCEKRRLAVLPEAIVGFQALVAEARGEMVAEVTSSEKLTAVQLKDLKAALKARVGKEVSLVSKIDSSILGGLIVKIGATMIDNSLKTKLQNLKVSMKGTG